MVTSTGCKVVRWALQCPNPITILDSLWGCHVSVDLEAKKGICFSSSEAESLDVWRELACSEKEAERVWDRPPGKEKH